MNLMIWLGRKARLVTPTARGSAPIGIRESEIWYPYRAGEAAVQTWLVQTAFAIPRYRAADLGALGVRFRVCSRFPRVALLRQARLRREVTGSDRIRRAAERDCRVSDSTLDDSQSGAGSGGRRPGEPTRARETESETEYVYGHEPSEL